MGSLFRKKVFDESEFQHLMIKHLNTNHSEVHATNEDIGKYFSDTVFFGEKPIIKLPLSHFFYYQKKLEKMVTKLYLQAKVQTKFLAVTISLEKQRSENSGQLILVLNSDQSFCKNFIHIFSKIKDWHKHFSHSLNLELMTQIIHSFLISCAGITIQD